MAIKARKVVSTKRAVKATEENLHEAFTQQKEFIANASHELRTPVAALKTTLEVLLQKPRPVHEYREGIKNAIEDIRRLEGLLKSILQLARAEERSIRGVPEDIDAVDVGLTCQAVMQRYIPFARERQVSLSYCGDEPLPVRARTEDLEQIWSNLLENAIRYSPPQSSIELSARRAKDAVASVTVEDHGSGIPASELPHIFDMFHRGDASRSRETGGYGLGLATVKRLVRIYGGTVEAESRSGKGTHSNGCHLSARLALISESLGVRPGFYDQPPGSGRPSAPLLFLRQVSIFLCEVCSDGSLYSSGHHPYFASSTLMNVFLTFMNKGIAPSCAATENTISTEWKCRTASR